MSAQNQTIPSTRLKPGAFLLLILLLLALWAATKIRFKERHSLDKHPGDAQRTQQCLNTYGVAYTLQEISTGKVHLVCVSPDGEFYDVVYRPSRLAGSTAYRPTAWMWQKVRYEFHTVDEYIEFLLNIRGDIRLAPELTPPGPYILDFPK